MAARKLPSDPLERLRMREIDPAAKRFNEARRARMEAERQRAAKQGGEAMRDLARRHYEEMSPVIADPDRGIEHVWHDLGPDHGELGLDEAITAPAPALELHIVRDAATGAARAWWMDENGKKLGAVRVGQA